MTALDPGTTVWRTSSYTGGNGNCVEVRLAPHAVDVRDSKDRQGPVLTFEPDRWRAFLTTLD